MGDIGGKIFNRLIKERAEGEVGDGMREMIHCLVEQLPEGEVCDVAWKQVNTVDVPNDLLCIVVLWNLLDVVAQEHTGLTDDGVEESMACLVDHCELQKVLWVQSEVVYVFLQWA